jgi:hypothetical protein
MLEKEVSHELSLELSHRERDSPKRTGLGLGLVLGLTFFTGLDLGLGLVFFTGLGSGLGLGGAIF